MKNLMLASIAGSLILLASSATARAACQSGTKVLGQTLVDTMSDCTIIIHPGWDLLVAQGYRERDYWLRPDGKIFVFVGTFDHDEEAKSNGSRVFYLFPRNFGSPEIDATGAIVRITSAAGTRVELDPDRAELISIAGYQISASPLEFIDAMSAAGGGFTLRPQGASLLLDLGWRLGGSPEGLPGRQAEFSRESGSICTVSNQDVLGPYGASTPPRLLFKADSDVEAFLQARCPQGRMP
jgi:hypothetical protein